MKHRSTQPGSAPRGRGAAGNPHNRFQPLRVELDDGVCGPSPVTECRPVTPRSTIARNTSPDVPFSQSINPYQGCEHGCIYCYARPTHAYLDLSPGLDFETRLTRKVGAAALLRRELARPGYRCSPIALGANTDPYQPVEQRYGVTREILEVLSACDHPVTITTKSTLVTRDIDLLADMAARGLCSVAVSVTTLDDELKRRMEPRAASGAARLATVAALRAAGIPVTLLFAPVIPALNDREMEEILRLGRQAGAVNAAYILLRLPLEVAPLFRDWLEAEYPLRAKHVMSVLRQCRGGVENVARFGERMRGTGPFAELLSRRFDTACRRLGLGQRETQRLDTSAFRPPRDGAQGDLFEEA